MACCRRAQQIIAQGAGQTRQRRGDRVCQRCMRVPLGERVQDGQRADQEVIPRRRESGTQPDQALNGVKARSRVDAVCLKCLAQPGLEVRDARARDPRQRGLVAATLRQAITLSKTLVRALDQRQTHDRVADINQFDTRPGDRPRRWAPQFASLECEPD